MRCLIEWIYRIAFGLYIRSHAQHIADLRALLKQQLDERDDLTVSIDATTRQLLKAIAAQDAANKAAQHAASAAPEETPAIAWEPIDKFPDPAPRAY